MTRPALPPPPPRDARFSSGARVARAALWIVFALIVVLLGGTGLTFWEDAEEYDRNRREATGTVKATSQREVKSRRGPRTVYEAAFTFTDETGVAHSDITVVTAPQFAELKAGDPVPVIYQANAPGKFQWLFSDEMRREHLRGAWTRTLIGIGLALFVMILIEVKMRRERAFARKAVAVHGAVTRLREHRGKSGTKTYTVFFEYRAPSGEMVTRRKWLLGIKPENMPAGKSLVVLFDPGRPRKGRLLESLFCVDLDSLGRNRRR
jgi:Protein of unknown function (DUF3592)